MQKRIYIETTIPSSYYILRTDEESLIRQKLTRQWWDGYAEMNEVVKEVREMRMRISEKCGHDLNKLFAYYQEVEKEMRKSDKYKFVDPKPPAEKPAPIESSEDKVAD